MHLIVVTDIHFHLPWAKRIESFAAQLASYKPDVLIMAGDLGEPFDLFARCLEAFSGVAEHKAALAGNHDVWQRTGAYTSQELWDHQLGQEAEAQGYTWLDWHNLTVGSLGICGSIAWYDYSGKHPHIRLSDDEYEQLKPMISNDGRYVRWRWSDRQMSDVVGEEFEERLSLLEDSPAIQDIIVATHVPVFPGCLRYIDDPEKEVANAYYANWSFGKRLLKSEKIRGVYSGHVHVERAVLVERNGLPPLPAYTNPSDYGEPAALLIDTESWDVSVIRRKVRARVL